MPQAGRGSAKRTTSGRRKGILYLRQDACVPKDTRPLTPSNLEGEGEDSDGDVFIAASGDGVSPAPYPLPASGAGECKVNYLWQEGGGHITQAGGRRNKDIYRRQEGDVTKTYIAGRMPAYPRKRAGERTIGNDFKK